MKKIFFNLLLCGFFSATIAQTVQTTLIDLNSESGLAPRFICPGTSKIYFAGFGTEGNGSELYVLDTNTNQISFIMDINPGWPSGPDGNAYLTIGDILYFTAETGNSYDSELWRSDGTAAGTYMVKNINPNGGSSISKMVLYNGKLIFNAQNNTYGNELWSSDGTETGTNIITDLVPGIGSYLSGDLAVADNWVYFTAGTNASGRELWKTDGTAVGTTMVKDIGPLSSIANDTNLTVMNNIVYFLANDGIHGREIWKSDGTEAGTTMVKDIYVGNGGSAYEWHGVASSSYLVFMAFTPATGYAVWKSDGTESGTSILMDINPSSDGFLNPQSFVTFEDKVYFTEDDGAGYELWVTDGTSVGTHILKDIGDESNYIEHVTAANGYLLFTAYGLSEYSTIWKSDGTESGTVELIDMNADMISDLDFVEHDNTVYFMGYDADTGNEMWTTDGTTAHTQILQDYNQGTSSTPESFTELGGQLLFTASKNGFRQLFTSDGTVANTKAVKDPNISPNAVYVSDPEFTNVNGTVFFDGNNGVSGKELCKSDGSSQHTTVVKDIVPGSQTPFPIGLGMHNALNGIYYFTATESEHAAELWRSDGTENGTYMVKDINPGVEYGFNNYANNSVVFDNHLYFTANDGTSPAIWKTDGTESGTVKVITVPDNQLYKSYPQVIAVIGNMLFFIANVDNSSYGAHSIWVSDGTQAGSMMLGNFPGSYSLSQYIVYNNELYFVKMGSPFGAMALMKTNGTVAGTVLVNNIDIGYPRSLRVCGSYLYFASNGSPWDEKLFRTDGSAAGTVQLDGFGPGASMREYECIEENLLYLNDLFPHSIKYTDGNTVGEFDFDVTNAENFSGYNSILELGHLGSKLFFSALTDQHGEELYVSDMESLLSLNKIATTYLSSDSIINYPNPTNGILNIATANNAQLENVSVYDLFGKKLLTTDASQKKIQVDLSSFAKGIYLVSAKTETGVHTGKVIVK